MFRKLLIVAIIALLPAIAGAQQTTDAKSKAIEALERGLNAAIQKGDVNAFKATVADDAVSIDGNGPMPIAEFLKMFSQFKVTKFAIDQVKVSFINDSTAVITYKWTGSGTMMGQTIPSPVWSSTTYANRAGKWVAVFHQETTVTPPPPPAKK